jgi:MSHA biogenesis protein MshJ
MNQYWENLQTKVNSMALRERALIFAAIAAVLVTLIGMSFVDPLLTEEKKLSAKVQQQQQKSKELQDQVEISSKAREQVANSPLHQRIEQARQQLMDGDDYLHGLHDRLVTPEKMPELLEQVLSHHGSLKLVDLQTLSAALLVEKGAVKPKESIATSASAVAAPESQAFKHGVIITVRGGYLELLQYLTELEHLPTQMFWGQVEMNVVEYPEVELTLTLYTLSLDKTWLKI